MHESSNQNIQNSKIYAKSLGAVPPICNEQLYSSASDREKTNKQKQ